MVLTRYDGNSLRPIHSAGNDPILFPRVSLPGGDSRLYEMSTLRRSPALATAIAPVATISSRQGQIHQGLLPGTTDSDDVEPDWEVILHNIQELGIHRFLTMIKKFPAIGLLLISLWIVWGRGFNSAISDVEHNMGIAGIVGGVITAIGVTVTSQHHSNNKDNAKSQTWFRLIVSTINGLCAVAMVVFGGVALSDLHDKEEENNFTLPAMSVNERTAHAGAFMGVALLIAIFSVMSLIFGVYALMKVHKAEHRVKEAKQRLQALDYLNPAYNTMDVY